MTTNNSLNQEYANNADGFELAGGQTKRKLTLTGGDVSMTGGGTATVSIPTSTTTLVGRDTADTLTNKTIDGSSNTITNLGTDTLADSAVTNSKLSTIAGEVGGEWTAWSPTVTGFSGTPTITARYTKVGKTVTLYISLSGTSNAINATFTVPFTINTNTSLDTPILTGDASSNYWGVCYVLDANTLQVRRGGTSPFSTFATSGTKTVLGMVTYESV